MNISVNLTWFAVVLAVVETVIRVAALIVIPRNRRPTSAMAWLLFLVILSATLFVMITSKRWVHYHGE